MSLNKKTTKPNNIFIAELPLIESNNELEKVKKKYTKYDSYYITCGCCKERREIFDRLWIKYQPYADSHFLTEIRINFHQRSWEMYVGNVLIGKKIEIKSKNEGPDFIINKTAYIECVAPTKGDSTKANTVPEAFIPTTPEEICGQEVPVDKLILRITQVINDKAARQYEKWKSKKWFDSKIPFIIAVNTGDLNHADEPDMPNVIKALFGFQFKQINIENGAINYPTRYIIVKSNNAPVSVRYFASPDLSFVSGVLFSNSIVLNHPENIGDDCIFVNNPFAENTVNKPFVALFKNWTASRNDNEISLKKNY